MSRVILCYSVLIIAVILALPCPGNASQPTLTMEEQTWINRNPVVRVRVGHAPPFMFTDGEVRGMAIDYLSKIFNQNHIQFTYVSESDVTWPQALDHIKRHGVVDMVPTAKITDIRKKSMLFTQEYIFAPWVIFTRNDSEFIGSINDLNGKTVAVEEGYVLHEILKTNYPGIRLRVASAKLTNYTEIPIRDLSTGLADAYIGNLLSTTYMIQAKGYTNVKVAAPTPFANHNQAMAIRNDWPELVNIINKSLSSMTLEEHAAIRNRWLSVRYEYGLNTKQILQWILGISGTALGLILIVIFWNRRLKAEVNFRKRIEEALRDRENLLNDMGRIAKIGGWEMDLISRTAKWTKGTYDIMGLDMDQPVPTLDEHVEYYLPEYRASVRDAISALIEQDIPLDFEARFTTVNGDIRWCRVLGRSIRNDNICVKLLGTFQDITQRKKDRDALKNNERRYKQAQRLGKVGNWEYELQTEQFWGSDEAKRIYGFDPDSSRFTTDEVENCIPERARIHQALVDLIETGKPYDLVFDIIPVSGRDRKTIKSIAEVLRDDQGKPLKVVGVIQDITQQKQTEDENRMLESQLHQAHKMEAIGTLAGGVAHEFNNILGIILGNTELAMDDIPEWNPTRDFLEEIRNSSLRGKDVVKQLLSFSHKNTLDKHPVDLALIVRDSMVFLRASIPANIEFLPVIPETCRAVSANPTQVHQVLINVCTNAAHAMESAGGRLTIRLEEVAITQKRIFSDLILEPGDHIRVSVSDTGHGIAEDIIEHIFDPFYTTKAVGKGSGLGLAVVHGIIKDHNGFIDIVTGKGKETTVSCYFPVIDAVPEIREERLKPVPEGKGTILFVDDEIPLVKIGQRQLERLGYHVEAMSDPVKALELFKASPEIFDMIITDMTMPKMTGDQLIKSVKAIRPELKAIICTGYSSRAHGRTAHEIGADGLIMKPMDRGKLARTVRDLLNGKPDITPV